MSFHISQLFDAVSVVDCSLDSRSCLDVLSVSLPAVDLLSCSSMMCTFCDLHICLLTCVLVFANDLYLSRMSFNLF